MNLRDPYTNLYMSSSPYAPKNPLINSKFANMPNYYIPTDLVSYIQLQEAMSNDQFVNKMNYFREYDKRTNAKNTLKTALSNNNINPASINSLNGSATQSGSPSAINNFNDYYTKQLALEEERLGMMKDYSNTQKALGITNTTMNAITGLTQLGLGIDAYFQNRKLNKQAIKNAELSNQQLERDMEYIKNERNRLNRIRSNTNNSINAKSSTSRVYA